MARSDARFAREHRLTRKSDFDRVLASAGRRFRVGPLRVHVRDNALTHPRLGLIVGKRFYRHAVSRNRVKRLVRESFRRRRLALPAMDVVVQILPERQAGDIQRALEDVWCRLADEGRHAG